MTRCDEFEAPGVSDAVPEPAENISKAVPSVEEIAWSTRRMQRTDYEPLDYGPREMKTKTKELGITEPIEYFDLFVPSQQFSYISTYTNKNALKERSNQCIEQAEQEFVDGELLNPDDLHLVTLRARPWHDTSPAEIGVFIGIMLLMGLTKCPRISKFWSTHTDVGNFPDICSVRLPETRKILDFH